MDCPKCKSSINTKDGIVGGRQRYKCKDCNYRYTVTKKSDVKPIEVRRMALEMYRILLQQIKHSRGFRGIFFKISLLHTTSLS